MDIMKLMANYEISLPVRNREINPETQSKIFGGCAGVYQACSSNDDCCPSGSPYSTRKCLYSGFYGKNVCLPQY